MIALTFSQPKLKCINCKNFNLHSKLFKNFSTLACRVPKLYYNEVEIRRT